MRQARTGSEVREFVDQLKNYSTTNISSIQKGLVPEVVDLNWKVMNYYIHNGIRKYVTYEKEGYVLKVVGVRYRNAHVTRETNNFDKRMTDAVNDGLVYPFMLFIDGYHVKWSTFRIVRNSKYTYIVCDNDTVEGIDPMHIHKVEMVNLPYTYMSYSEKRKLDPNYDELFRFDEDGKLSNIGPIVYSLKLNDLDITYKKLNVLNGGRMENHNLDIPKEFKLTKNNVLCWRNGLFDKNLDPEIKNLNILTINDGDPIDYDLDMRIFYRDVTNHNISNITIPDNEDLLKSLIIEEESEMPELDIVKFGRDFDFKYKTDTEYDDNVDAGIRYISRYNQKFFDELYQKRIRIHSREYLWEDLKTRIINNKLSMPRGYHTYRETYVMIFADGELWDKYPRIRYENNNFVIPLTPNEIKGIDDNIIFEIVYFTDVNNSLLEVHCTRTNNTIENTTIKFDELMVFANYTKEHLYKDPKFTKRSIFDVDYTLNEKTKEVTFKDPEFYLDKTIWMAATKQFRYAHFMPKRSTVSFFLPREFMACLNTDRYMVFHNGRLLSKDMYRVITPRLDLPATEICVHIRRVAEPGDRVDIFYIPYDFNNTDLGRSNQVDVVSVRASVDKQPIFGIPFPTKSYNLTRDNFLLLRGSVLLDQSRYNVVGRKLILTDPEDYVDYGRELTFIFLYNKNIDINPYGAVEENQVLTVDPQFTFAETNDQREFEIPYPHDDFKGYFFVTYRGLYVNPKRYQINPLNNKLIFNELRTGISKDTAVIFVFVYPTNNAKIDSSAVSVTATIDNQLKFPIPVPYAKYLEEENSFFLIRNGVFLNDDEFYINNKEKSLELLTTRGLDKGQELIFNFMIGKDLSIKTAIEEVRAEEDGQRVFKLPLPFRDFEHKTGRYFCVIGDTYIDQRRFEVVGNDLRFFNTEDAILEGRTLSFIFIYTEEIDSEAATIGKIINTSKLAKFITKSVDITSNGQRKFTVPWEDSMLMNKKIIVNIGSTFINDDQYTISKATNTITFIDDSVITDKGRSITFTLIDSDYTVIEKEELSVEANVDDQMTFDIPLPFDNYFKQGNSLIVFNNKTFVSPNRYMLDVAHNTLTFINQEDALHKGQSITFLYMYIANAGNKTHTREDVNHAMINERGYLYLNRSDLNNSLYKNSYFMFINGKKINRDNILDIANNIIRIKNDVQTRFNTLILDYTPEIEELKRYRNINSDYDIILNQVTNEDINKLFNVYTNITDLEEHIVPDTSTEAIINDIIRVHYLGNNINKGLPFAYTYETATLKNRTEIGISETTHRYISPNKFTLTIPQGVNKLRIRTISSPAKIPGVTAAEETLGYFKEDSIMNGSTSFVLPSAIADIVEKHIGFENLNISSVPLLKRNPTENDLNSYKFMQDWLPRRLPDENSNIGRDFKRSYYQKFNMRTLNVWPGLKYKITIPENGFVYISYNKSKDPLHYQLPYRFEFDSDRSSTLVVYSGDTKSTPNKLNTFYDEIYSGGVNFEFKEKFIQGTHYWTVPDGVGQVIVSMCTGYANRSGNTNGAVRYPVMMQFCGYNDANFSVSTVPEVPYVDKILITSFYDEGDKRFDHRFMDYAIPGKELSFNSDGTIYGSGVNDVTFYTFRDVSDIDSGKGERFNYLSKFGVDASVSRSGEVQEVETYMSVKPLENYTIIVSSAQATTSYNNGYVFDGAVAIQYNARVDIIRDTDKDLFISNVLTADAVVNPNIDYKGINEYPDGDSITVTRPYIGEEDLEKKDYPVYTRLETDQSKDISVTDTNKVYIHR